MNSLDQAIADYQRMIDKATTETEKQHFTQRRDWLVELKELRQQVKQNRAVVAKLRRR